MERTKFKLGRHKNGVGVYAEVALAIEPNDEGPLIEFVCSGRGFFSQGYVEDVPAVGYDHWKEGARVGILFALQVAQSEKWNVRVLQIEGMTTDTNPTIVGVAAAFAAWKSLNFEPSTEIVENVESQAFASWRLPHLAIPEFS